MPQENRAKPLGVRTRTNRTTSRTILRELEPEEINVPDLPELRDDEGLLMVWHPLAIQWWCDIWSSPVAPQIRQVDIHGLYRMVRLVQDYWITGAHKARREISAEIRIAQKDYGLTPYDRMRLQWQWEDTDRKQAEGTKRRAKEAPKTEAPEHDPRFDEMAS